MSLDDATTKPHDHLAKTLADDLTAVNHLIRQRMASEHAPRIPEVTAHLVEAGGKRLRPMLTLATARMCGYSGPYHIHLAATVEFIHTATLLHDDVVDDSAQRRGRPTAILANASATIAEGEVLQLTAAQDIATSEDVYFKVIRGKTAALFAAACEVGTVIADQEEQTVRAFAAYGDALGISFQIVDDLLDYTGGMATGKNIGDDFRERKLTLPVIKAIAAADDTERAFWHKCIAKGQQEAGDLSHAIALMTRHGTLEATRAQALYWAEAAKSALRDLPDHPLKPVLTDLSDYVVARLN